MHTIAALFMAAAQRVTRITQRSKRKDGKNVADDIADDIPDSRRDW
jgi:hypothetical protein